MGSNPTGLALFHLKMTYLQKPDEFYEYYLQAQRDGHEVYLGDGYVLVRYADGSVGMSGGLLFSGFTVGAEDLEGLEDLLEEICQERFRKGVHPELTPKLSNLCGILTSWVEEHSERLCQQALLDSGLAYIEGGDVWLYEDAFED